MRPVVCGGHHVLLVVAAGAIRLVVLQTALDQVVNDLQLVDAGLEARIDGQQLIRSLCHGVSIQRRVRIAIGIDKVAHGLLHMMIVHAMVHHVVAVHVWGAGSGDGRVGVVDVAVAFLSHGGVEGSRSSSLGVDVSDVGTSGRTMVLNKLKIISLKGLTTFAMEMAGWARRRRG